MRENIAERIAAGETPFVRASVPSRIVPRV